VLELSATRVCKCNFFNFSHTRCFSHSFSDIYDAGGHAHGGKSYPLSALESAAVWRLKGRSACKIQHRDDSYTVFGIVVLFITLLETSQSFCFLEERSCEGINSLIMRQEGTVLSNTSSSSTSCRRKAIRPPVEVQSSCLMSKKRVTKILVLERSQFVASNFVILIVVSCSLPTKQTLQGVLAPGVWW